MAWRVSWHSKIVEPGGAPQGAGLGGAFLAERKPRCIASLCFDSLSSPVDLDSKLTLAGTSLGWADPASSSPYSDFDLQRVLG